MRIIKFIIKIHLSWNVQFFLHLPFNYETKITLQWSVVVLVVHFWCLLLSNCHGVLGVETGVSSVYIFVWELGVTGSNSAVYRRDSCIYVCVRLVFRCQLALRTSRNKRVIG